MIVAALSMSIPGHFLRESSNPATSSSACSSIKSLNVIFPTGRHNTAGHKVTLKFRHCQTAEKLSNTGNDLYFCKVWIYILNHIIMAKDFREVAQSWLDGDFDPETKGKVI